MKQIVFMTLFVGAAVLVYTGFVVFSVPGSNNSPAIGSAWVELRIALPICAGGLLAAVLLHDGWIELRTHQTARMWSNLSELHLRVFGLTIVGLGIVIGTKYGGGVNAPSSTGRWVVVAVAAAQGIWLLAQLIAAEGAPSQRRGGRIAAGLVGAGIGIAIAASGLAADTAASVAQHREATETLEAATGLSCRPARRWRRDEPRAWERGEASCRDGSVRVRYLWLAHGDALKSYTARRLKALGGSVPGSGSLCAEGGFDGTWHNSLDPSQARGKLRCFSRHGMAQIEWSNDDRNLYAIARQRPPLRSLYRWWRHAPQPCC